MRDLVLIVDDNQRLCDSLLQNFEEAGMRAVSASSRAGAIREFANQNIQAVLLDLMVGEDSGIDILVDLKRADPRVPVIMITGYATVDTAVQALKLGASDYVKKPLDFDVLHKVVTGAIRVSMLSQENSMLKARLLERSLKATARSRQMNELLEKVQKLAVTELPILITGENGTGKELIADALHEGSRRSLKKFVKVNCAAFPESLLDNELFGHERGSFTGADSVYRGMFEQASSGTLFLDEIADMPLAIQAKILRALQNREIRRIGGSEMLSIDVRFIAATNQKIDDLVGTGRFRQDLYYRLCGAVLPVPPLRERTEDIPELAGIFVEEYCVSNSLATRSISPRLMELFLHYSWPGNVRELKNTINYSCAISSGPQIDLQDLPPAFDARDREHLGGLGMLNVRELAEKALIVKMLQQSNFNKMTAAARLSMSRKTLYNKIARYGITATNPRLG